MVDLSKKRTTVNSKRELTLSPVPQRELRKRKNLRFDGDENDDDKTSLSTSDFVLRTNKEWTFVASSFNLPKEDNRIQNGEGEKELLVLCNYFGEEEKVTNLVDDDEDDIPYAIFAESNITWRPESGSTVSVSSLHFASMLRLEKRQPTIKERKKTILDDDNLEDAFQGRLSCANFQKNRSHRNSKTANEKKGSNFVADEEEDFWNVVEF